MTGTRRLPAGEPRKASPRHSRRRTRVGIQEAGLGTCRSGALAECEPGTQGYDALATFLSKSTVTVQSEKALDQNMEAETADSGSGGRSHSASDFAIHKTHRYSLYDWLKEEAALEQELKRLRKDRDAAV